jgi:predicted nucleic acid-binding protein
VDFVIDNSIIMAWCFKDEINHYSDLILDNLDHYTAVVPSIWPLEVGNVLLVAERKKRLTEADSSRFLALLSDLPILIEQESPERMIKETFTLARSLNLSSYDASYLDLAIRKGLPIASLDKNLIRAAKKVKLPVFLETN